MAFDKGGLGTGRENWHDANQTNTRDPSTLADPKRGITQENLDRLESVRLVKVRGEKTQVLLYFMTDNRVI